MQLDEFEQIINCAIQQIPREFKSILEKEQIQVLAREKVPPAIREKFTDRVVFGVFVGLNYAQRLNPQVITHEPARIEVYKESFEQIFHPEDGTGMEREIMRTVVHEIAHYFGFSEKEIQDRGY